MLPAQVPAYHAFVVGALRGHEVQHHYQWLSTFVLCLTQYETNKRHSSFESTYTIGRHYGEQVFDIIGLRHRHQRLDLSQDIGDVLKDQDVVAAVGRPWIGQRTKAKRGATVKAKTEKSSKGAGSDGVLQALGAGLEADADAGADAGALAGAGVGADTVGGVVPANATGGRVSDARRSATPSRLANEWSSGRKMLALGTRVTVQLGEGDDGAVTEGGEAGGEDGDGSGKRWRATVLEYSTDSETCTLEVDGLGVLDEVRAEHWHDIRCAEPLESAKV